MDRIAIGRNNEERAARFLEASGHLILERNWRHDKREVDIISETREYIVVTEVKTLMHGSLERPQDVVNRKKQRHIIRTAEAYVWEKRLAKPVRFDLVLIYEGRDGFRIEHIPDAFYPD
jgi:putative endonuclease